MSTNTKNHSFSELSTKIHLGEGGAIIKSIDENNGIEFKKPHDGEYIVVRGADAITDRDFITKRQFDNEFATSRFLIPKKHDEESGEAIPFNILIGNTKEERLLKCEYIISNVANNKYKSGKITAIINNNNKVKTSYETLFIDDELNDITLNIIVENTNVYLSILNNYTSSFEIIMVANQLSKFKIAHSQIDQSDLNRVVISNLQPKNGVARDDVLLIEDIEDGIKKRIKIDDLVSNIQSDLLINDLNIKVAPSDTDILVIEDSEQNYKKKKINLSTIKGVYHLDSMSFNA